MPTMPTFASLISAVLLATSLAAQEREIVSYDEPYGETGRIIRLDPAFDELVPPDAVLEKLAEGFFWSEGPVWDFAKNRLYFSDIPRNTVFQWAEGEGISVLLSPSGFTGEFYDGREPGANGLVFDRDGKLVLCQHGDRRMARLNDRNWGFTTIAADYQGKRLNSPNDACYDSKGNLFFTDPPYGLAPSATKELEHYGIYRVTPDGVITLLTTELERPNGVAISPDEKTLYATNSHNPRPIVMAWPILENGTLGPSRVLLDTTSLRGEGMPGGVDGLKTDIHGNIWTTAPGGVAVLNPEGKLLGRIITGTPTANCAFGGPDGSTFYLTANDTLVRIETSTRGYFPFQTPK